MIAKAQASSYGCSRIARVTSTKIDSYQSHRKIGPNQDLRGSSRSFLGNKPLSVQTHVESTG